MKKSLIAVAVASALTAPVMAQNVQIDGIVDNGLQQVNYKGASNTVSGFAGNGSSTSQINFRGSEDLGGGLRATWRFESQFNTVSNFANTGTASSINSSLSAESINSSVATFGNGEIRLGLSGGFGAVDIGAPNYHSLSSYTTGQPFGTAIGSGFRTYYILDGQATSQSRAENAIRYLSPNFGGVRVGLYHSAKQTKSTGQTSANAASTTGLYQQANAFSTSIGAYDQIGTTEAHLSFSSGPLNISATQLIQDSRNIGAVSSSDASTTGLKLTVNTVGASYGITSATRLHGLWQSRKSSTASTETSGYTVSASHTMGAIVLMAQVGSTTQDASTYAGNKSTMWGFGADYNLSKRTALYLRAEAMNDKARLQNAAVNPNSIANTTNVNGLDDQKFSRAALGIRHSF